ncbi:hypothetical protein CR513_13899, partial [Mucuna pruriens]
MEMSNLTTKLKSLKLELDEDLIVYGYLYLVHEKSQFLDIFKSLKVEVELQLGKKIKAVKFDCGSEYYGRYDESGEQYPGPFPFFLKECEIVPQDTISVKPNMNSVTKQRDQTLKDIVRNTKRSFSRYPKVVDGIGRPLKMYYGNNSINKVDG